MQQDFFKKNRARLKEVLGDNMLVLTAYDKMQFANDASAPFKQESNFWWLTGIDLPSWKLVVEGNTSEYLVRPDVSDVEKTFETWYSDEHATELSGVDTVISQSEFLQKLEGYAANNAKVMSAAPMKYGEIHCHPNPAQDILWSQLVDATLEPCDGRPLIAKLRAIKSDEEIEAIQRAIHITSKAFELVKSRLSSYTNESEIAADFTYEFMKNGANHAYDPIVAFGENACTLHYVKNNAELSGGLILLDVGACVDGYSADITRTYAFGEIHDRHSQVHAAVERAQKQIIEMIQPGLKVEDYSNKVDEIMKHQLVELGLIKDKTDKKYRKYFPHAIGHGLGVDVHDSLGRAAEIVPGMVMTVEPGIYIADEGIGVRIEDDILITEEGNINLSESLSTRL